MTTNMHTLADLAKQNDEESRPMIGDPRLRDLSLRRGINPSAPTAASTIPNFGQTTQAHTTTRAGGFHSIGKPVSY